jgi:hypothetical protein
MERVSKPLRETWETGREARDRTLKTTSFYVSSSGDTDSYILTREKSPADITTMAGLHGAVGGTFVCVEMGKPANERNLRPSPEQAQQIREVATQIAAAAPACMCNGRLSGAAAAFADCFAIVMLSAPDASAGKTAA